MSIFSEATPQMAFLKMGIYGEAGTGKTFTSMRVAIGLHRFVKSDKPVFFFDTETGSDFVRDKIEAETGQKLRVAKTRAFSDLIKGLDEEVPPGSIVLIDSVTHFWNEIIESFMKKNNISRLTLRHWQPLKTMWREFTDRYVNSKLHIIVAGRSADKWEEVEDEDGSKELRKVGTKMRTETEMGYEPSLLVEMQLVQDSARVGSTLTHRAWIRKDRFDLINGQHFDDPGFEVFLPHIERLNLGGEHKAIEEGRNSQALFNNSSNLGESRMLRKEILLEKITNEIRKLFPGQNEKDKAARIALMEEIFGTNSWTEISTFLKQDILEKGLETLVQKVQLAVEPVPVPAPIPAEVKPAKTNKKGGK
jgi:hypothetical protein